MAKWGIKPNQSERNLISWSRLNAFGSTNFLYMVHNESSMIIFVNIYNICNVYNNIIIILLLYILLLYYYYIYYK